VTRCFEETERPTFAAREGRESIGWLIGSRLRLPTMRTGTAERPRKAHEKEKKVVERCSAKRSCPPRLEPEALSPTPQTAVRFAFK
jgi:hypothetical protein